MAEDEVEAVAQDFLAGPGKAPEGLDHGSHGGHEAPGESTSVRELAHGGHQIRIETTYRITIDGRPLHGHVEVLPSGAVHYHRFPQYAPQSALDVVKTIIDTIWDKPEVPDELGDGPEPEPEPHDHDHDHHDHDHGDHR
jgi:hypothetical protein